MLKDNTYKKYTDLNLDEKELQEWKKTHYDKYNDVLREFAQEKNKSKTEDQFEYQLIKSGFVKNRDFVREAIWNMPKGNKIPSVRTDFYFTYLDLDIELDGGEHYNDGLLIEKNRERDELLLRNTKIKFIKRYRNKDIWNGSAFPDFFWFYWDSIFELWNSRRGNDYLLFHIQELSKKMRENPNCIISNEIKVNVIDNTRST